MRRNRNGNGSANAPRCQRVAARVSPPSRRGRTHAGSGIRDSQDRVRRGLSAAKMRHCDVHMRPAERRAEEHARTECFAVPVNDIDGGYPYTGAVRFEIEEQELGSYQRAADFINFSNVDVVSVQHEFGIYGGVSGSHVLALVRALNMPVVTTLHTVLRDPDNQQRRVGQELAARSTRLVVMTERGRQMLGEYYQIPSHKIDLIPHGIPDMPFVDPTFYKEQFAVEGKTVLLTFGLLSPNKGIESVLNALPQIVAEFPDLVFLGAGATHSHELRERGEY